MGIPGWPLSRKLSSRSQGHSSGLRQVLQQVSGSPQSPHPLTVHAIREACDISPLVTERPSRAESSRSPVAQKNKGEGMAADSPLCPAGAKSDLTGQQGLHGAMDVTGESLASSSKGREKPGSQCWPASCSGLGLKVNANTP